MTIEEIYKSITDYINDAQARGEDIVFYINKMATDLDNSEISSEDLERERLDNQIIATSQLLNQRHNIYTTQLLNFVRVLQGYITKKYTSVDNFLSDNKIKVKSVFADISDTVGYPILPTNISDVS